MNTTSDGMQKPLLPRKFRVTASGGCEPPVYTSYQGAHAPRSPRRPVILSGCLCLVWLSLAIPIRAAEYVQRQGNATIRLDAERVEGGRVQIRLSDTLHLTVSIEGDSSLEVQLPAVLTASKDWQVRSEAAPKKMPLAAGRVLWSTRYRLTPLKPGELSLGLAPFRFRPNPDRDHWEEVAWQPIPVQVNTEIYRANVSELRDIAPPEELAPAPSWRKPVIWTGLAVGFLLLLLSGWAVWRSRGGREAALSAGQWALGELEAISLPPDSSSGLEPYYTRISDIIRKYLELRYQLPAPEQTTTEFLETMGRSPQLQREQQTILRDFLERCDQVKFARAQPSEEECRQVAALARAFVEQTAGEKVSGIFSDF